MENFDYKAMEALALEQLKSGKPLLGKGGAFAPLLEKILNAALEGEMDAHMDSDERSLGNRRNGYTSKQVQTGLGEVTVHTPRDRDSRFEPEFIKKRERILADSVSDRIIGLYALGNSTRQISDWMEENLGNRVSADTISSITDRILPELQSWRSRPLDAVYPIIWMDAIHYKVMDEKNRPTTRAIYNVLGIDHNGYKDLLGMYISKSEGANFWLSVLTDLQSRGVKDILIACTDNLTGFSDAIRRIIYTTNTVEGYHRQIRKVTKNKGVFTNDTALEKLVYLAYRNIRKKWTMPLSNWGQTAQQLAIKFPDRFKLFD